MAQPKTPEELLAYLKANASSEFNGKSPAEIVAILQARRPK